MLHKREYCCNPSCNVRGIAFPTLLHSVGASLNAEPSSHLVYTTPLPHILLDLSVEAIFCSGITMIDLNSMRLKTLSMLNGALHIVDLRERKDWYRFAEVSEVVVVGDTPASKKLHAEAMRMAN